MTEETDIQEDPMVEMPLTDLMRLIEIAASMADRPETQVFEFHEVFESPFTEELGVSEEEVWKRIQKMRLSLITEEYNELLEAWENKDFIEVVDALGDLIYVIYGFALSLGIYNLDAVVEEIHHSNMSKLGEDGLPILREDGKILKGPDYSPPNIAEVLGIEDE